MFSNVHVSDDKQKLAFELKGVDLSVANAIRRTCLVEVPIPGIQRDSISLKTEDNNLNTSSFHDEFLSHRIAFARLRINPQDADQYKILICSSTDRFLPYTNETDDIMDFSTNDMMVLKNDVQVACQTVFLSNYLIARLKPGQQLKASMIINTRCVRDKDMEDYRYHYQPCRVKFCYKNYKHSASKKEIMTIDDEASYMGKESKTPKIFLFEVCGFGSPFYQAIQIVNLAFDVILSKIHRLLKGWNDHDIMSRETDQVLTNTVIYTIQNEDHTLGNLLASKIRQYTNLKIANSSHNFVSYQKKHPLECVLIIKIKLDDQLAQSHDDILKKSCMELVNDIDNLHKAFERACSV